MIQVSAPRFRSIQRTRLLRRLLLHHLVLFALATISVGAIFITRPYRDVWMKASFATAYPALFLLLATLVLGPFNILTGRRNPVSSDVRRDIGIWAGILGILHTAVGQNVHLRGRPWLYYVYEHRSRHLLPFRHDLFGLSNYTGLICTLLIILLLATSNDYALRRLGTRNWKTLQRWNYAAFALLAVHALGYESIEHQKAHFVITTIAVLGITLLTQASAFLLLRTKVASRTAADQLKREVTTDREILDPNGGRV